MQGQIIKIVSDLHIVSCDGETYPCKCRGIFRKEHITPLVGDYVLFSKEKNLIESIVPRKNEFQRPRVSNIDQALIVVSLKEPEFSSLLLEKLILQCIDNDIQPIVYFSKIDKVNNLKDFKKYFRFMTFFSIIAIVHITFSDGNALFFGNGSGIDLLDDLHNISPIIGPPLS